MERLHKCFGSRYWVAAFAGLLLACAFPTIGFAGLGWVAPAILAGSALGRGGWERFRIGYVGGLVFYLVSLYWLLHIPFRWMGVPIGPAAGLLGLSAYMALYPAVWVWLVTSAAMAGSGAVEMSWRDAAAHLVKQGWLRRAGVALYAAVAWVGLEMIIARLFTGFPWDLLGVSQYQFTPLIQVAAFTGVYGVSFVVIWGSAAILMAVLVLTQRPAARSLWAAELILPVLAVAGLFTYGMRQVRNAEPPSRTIRVALLQPAIPQTLIWDSSKNLERFQEVLRLSESALTNKPDLLIWPESAVPALLRQDQDTHDAITGLARDHSTWMIIGADDFSVKPDAASPRDVHYYNASFLIAPDGSILDTYRKRSLVIFGEYVPLERWLPFLKYVTPIEGGFTPGEQAEPFELPSLGIVTSVLICFEDIFPGLAREGAQPDTDFLVNLTNNGWFGESAAQWQHGATAVLRAVENGIPLVRCSNNGLTCWVDRYGRIRQIFRDASGSEYGKGFLLCDIPVLGPDELREPTPYHRHGDRFGWACTLIAALWLPINFRPGGKSPAA